MLRTKEKAPGEPSFFHAESRRSADIKSRILLVFGEEYAPALFVVSEHKIAAFPPA